MEISEYLIFKEEEIKVEKDINKLLTRCFSIISSLKMGSVHIWTHLVGKVF